MTDCPRCGENHYDMSRPIVPTCPFTPQRTGPGGMADPDIVAMARLAQHDDRMATGALYGALADEIVRLRQAAVDRDIEKILAMTDDECRQAGLAEFGSEEAWRKAMGELRAKMLKAAGIPEQEGASEALPEPRSGDTSKPLSADDAEVMRIWRKCGLPEYFLGNGGSNHKLVAFAKACCTSSVGRGGGGKQ